jgi:hypothetical protein
MGKFINWHMRFQISNHIKLIGAVSQEVLETISQFGLKCE